jgi:hypothetical protein
LPAAIFGALGGLAVLAMLGFTATYIASAWRDDISGLPDSSWPWYLYMVTFAAIAATATWTGLRLGHEHDRTNESASLSFVTNGLAAMFTSLAFTTVAGLLLLRMITTDSLAWTRVGIAVAIALYAGVTYARDRETSNSFLPTMYNGVATLAIGIGAVSVAANLLLAIDEPDRVSGTGQALTFGLAGVAVLVIAWWRVRPWLAVAGVALLAVATIFAARMGNNHDTAIPAGLVLLSWLVMATTIALQRAERGAHLGQVLRLAAIGVGFVAIVAAVGANGEADPGSTGWHVMAFTLVMAAALVATEGWLRQDRRWVIGASVLAMAALLLQIGGQEPSNIQAYTVPVALYLLALGWFSRRNRSLRDVLLALGSVALLAPPLLAAQADGDATQLLIGGVEALVLLVAGTFLRLRVAIAAGVAAITLIALRFLVDAALALEGWITLLAGGLLLLVIGTVLTIWKDALRERLERLQAGWHEMG